MEENNAKAFFYLLKEEVAKTYLSKTASLHKSIHEWTGNEIRDFQEDLAAELNERISERWFYTHIKPRENEKLPRIDMLNILSKYIGCLSWDDFRVRHKDQIKIKGKTQKKRTIKRLWYLIPILVVVAAIYFSMVAKAETIEYTFCFYDKDMGVPLTDTTVEVTLLNSGESPLNLYSDKKGCVTVETNENSIRFVVKALYFKTDTIERNLIHDVKNEIIELQRDDYALMIRLFATSDIQDWEKRRNQLDNMINDDAVIFQITADNTGMEMYNKTDFIDKLTTPLKSLGDIEIVETVYENEKIINLRFIQK